MAQAHISMHALKKAVEDDFFYHKGGVTLFLVLTFLLLQEYSSPLYAIAGLECSLYSSFPNHMFEGVLKDNNSFIILSH